MNEMQLAIDLARKAGAQIMRLYGQNLEIAQKEDDAGYISPLTEADRAADRIICQGLREHFDYPILSEESGGNGGRLMRGFVWIIDPLDGTKEFLNRNGEFTVNIALVQQGEPIMGVIYAPATGELYYGARGHGAYCQRNGAEERIRVSAVSDPAKMTIARSRSHASEALDRVIGSLGTESIITSGSSIKGCMVASGKADAYIRLGSLSEWDICAMHCIVTEAGGRITGLGGRRINFNKQNPVVEGGFAATNSLLHSSVLEAVNGS